MIFTILALLVGAAVGYQGYIEGFRKMWPVLFNTLVSIYLAVMGTRAICKLSPEIANYQYFKTLILICFAVVAWLLLYGVIKLLTKEDFIHSLPRLFEDIGGAVLGFFLGLISTGFVIFSIFIFVSNSKATPDFIQKQIGMPAVNTVKNSCIFTGTISLQSLKSNDNIPAIIGWFTGTLPTVKSDPNAEENNENFKIIEKK